jgi:hypothetical protein
VDDAEFRRTDFEDLRDFALASPGTLSFWPARTCTGSLSAPLGSHELPGFGPFGTAGAHCFDTSHPLYLRIAAIAAVRADYPVLQSGRQYVRPVSVFGEPFGPARTGELFGWSRILVDEEALCIINPNGSASRGVDVLVDVQLNPPESSFTVIMY